MKKIEKIIIHGVMYIFLIILLIVVIIAFTKPIETVHFDKQKGLVVEDKKDVKKE
jgi:hypothetical protein